MKPELRASDSQNDGRSTKPLIELVGAYRLQGLLLTENDDSCQASKTRSAATRSSTAVDMAVPFQPLELRQTNWARSIVLPIVSRVVTSGVFAEVYARATIYFNHLNFPIILCFLPAYY